MRVLIVTVAGMSSRFSQSIGKPCIKCLYHNNSIKECLLYRLLSQKVRFDRYIIVGGYQFGELKKTVETEFTEFTDRIIYVENRHFEDYGSGYSLFLGIKAALQETPDEIVFAEGDLFIDGESYIKACNAHKSIITCNSDPILANKAVVLYYDEENRVHYVYDTGHKSLVIKEPFQAVYNSGQIWKFADIPLVNKTYESLSKNEWKGTNLVFVEKYFQNIPKGLSEIIFFNRWINCNTVEDFNRIQRG